MLRFSIRDLLWLTLLAAFAVAWFVDRTRFADERQSLQKQQVALTEQLEVAKRRALVESVLRQFERKWHSQEELETRMDADELNDATVRYLRAVRDPQNGFHYPVIWRDEPKP